MHLLAAVALTCSTWSLLTHTASAQSTAYILPSGYSPQCPPQSPYACGAACFNPAAYTCVINMANPSNSTLKQVTAAGSNATSSPMTTTTMPSTLSQVINPSTPAAGNTVVTTTNICSMIYQEGCQDSSCNVLIGSQLVLQCYNPLCMVCTGNALCPVSAPMACGTTNFACYDPAQYSCSNGQLQQVPGGKNVLTLPPVCPGSGSPLAGSLAASCTSVTTPTTGSQVIPSTLPPQNVCPANCVPSPPTTSVPATTAPATGAIIVTLPPVATTIAPVQPTTAAPIATTLPATAPPTVPATMPPTVVPTLPATTVPAPATTMPATPVPSATCPPIPGPPTSVTPQGSGPCTQLARYYVNMTLPTLTIGCQKFNNTVLQQILLDGCNSGLGSTDQSVQLAFNLIPVLVYAYNGGNVASILQSINYANTFLCTYPPFNCPATYVTGCTQTNMETVTKTLLQFVAGTYGPACPGVNITDTGCTYPAFAGAHPYQQATCNATA